MPSPLPRRDRCRDRVAPRMATTAAFPKLSLGRLPHFVLFEACSAFTHVRAYRLAESLKRSFPSKASAASLPPLPLRLLLAEATVARWELHPLKNGAFARRTTMGTTLLSTSRTRRKVRRRKVMHHVPEVVRAAPDDQLSLVCGFSQEKTLWIGMWVFSRKNTLDCRADKMR